MMHLDHLERARLYLEGVVHYKDEIACPDTRTAVNELYRALHETLKHLEASCGKTDDQRADD